MLLCVLQNKHLLYLDLRLQYQYNKTKFCQLVFITTLRTGENTKQKSPRQIFQSTLRVEFAYESETHAASLAYTYWGPTHCTLLIFNEIFIILNLS